VKRHLQRQVKDQGLWACHLDPELGGAGFGPMKLPMKLALMHELLGRCTVSMEIFGNQAPDSGNSELLAAGANDAQKERWLWPNLDGRSAAGSRSRSPAARDIWRNVTSRTSRESSSNYLCAREIAFNEWTRDAPLRRAAFVALRNDKTHAMSVANDPQCPGCGPVSAACF
jgi:alkylation response protein AidB-like acyl-CoA dehydrogenase